MNGLIQTNSLKKSVLKGFNKEKGYIHNTFTINFKW